MRILITDDVHPILITKLNSIGYIVDYQPDISIYDVKLCIENYDGLIINSKILVDREMMNLGSKLKWIGRLGSGLDIIDLNYAKNKHIQILSTPEANCNAVAEHALGMLIGLLRNIPRANKEVKNMHWLREKNRGEELSVKKVGIIGCGHTGSRLAHILGGFGCEVKVYDKYKTVPRVHENMYQVQDLSDLRDCDIISFHLPLSPETKYFCNKDFINQIQNPFYLINTSRGSVVNTIDLIDALQNGKIIGAALDVFENEKPNSYSESEKSMYNELYAMENTILTPHIAGWTFQSKEKIAEVLFNKIAKLLA